MSLLWIILVRLITVGLVFTCDKLNLAPTDATVNSAAQWTAVLLLAIIGYFMEKHFPDMWRSVKGYFVGPKEDDATPHATGDVSAQMMKTVPTVSGFDVASMIGTKP